MSTQLPDPKLPWPIPLEAVALIADSEGLRLKAYLCPAGKWTIGWGETDGVHPGDTCTKEQADAWLCDDLLDRTKQIRALCEVAPGENELAAFVSLAYNIGIEAFKNSTVLRLHNAGNKQGAAQAFGLFNKARDPVTEQLTVFSGLVIRRAREAALYLTPETPEAATWRQQMPQAVAPQPPLAASPTVQTSATAIGVGSLTLLASIKEIGGQFTDTAKEFAADLGLTPIQMLAAVIVIFGVITLHRRWKQRQGGLA